jgi:TonB-dependent receptor
MVLAVLFCTADAWAQSAAIGALRVRIIDQDWDVPLAGATVQVLEVNQKCMSGEDGNVLFDSLPGGSYTLVISAPGFERRVMAQVVVVPGEARSEEVRLIGAFTDMDEFLVKDIEILTGGSDLTQLNIRSQSSSVMDNVGSDMMSKAGAGTAAAALKMVSGATIQDGKYAVIRGLGDRYTSTLLNGVRLPTADREKRAVSMDQFPSAMIESVQVTKTFTPDQQGDATGGINIKTKGVPDKGVLQFSVSSEWDSNATGNDQFKSYHSGGNDFGGMRGLTHLDFYNDRVGGGPRGGSTSTANGTTTADKQYSTQIEKSKPSPNYGFKFGVGDYVTLGDWKFGGLLLGSYSQKYKYADGERYGVQYPATSDARGVVPNPNGDLSVENSVDEQLWTAGLTLGAKNDYNNIRFTTLYTHQSRDVVNLSYEKYEPAATSTQDLLFRPPGRPRPPPIKIGEQTRTTRSRDIDRAILQYTENANGNILLAGDHTFSALNDSTLDWNAAYNLAESVEPDRRSWSGYYEYDHTVKTYDPARLAANGLNPLVYVDSDIEKSEMGLNGVERRWQDTREGGLQAQLNYKQPYSVSEGWDGWFKGGVFGDFVKRSYRSRVYRQDGTMIPTLFTDVADEYDFSGFNLVDQSSLPTTLSPDSIDYDGVQNITAWYLMGRLPLPEWLDIIGGARVETTELTTKISAPAGLSPEIRRKVPFGLVGLEQYAGRIDPLPYTAGDADSSMEQVDVLPAIAWNLKPFEELSFRLAYSQTIARPIFKEITPVIYPEFDRSRVFLGNPDLKISKLENYDARLEWRPDKNSPDMLAAGVYFKKIIDPIQYSLRQGTGIGDPLYVYPENYGEGEIRGIEFEARKALSFIWSELKDFSVGGNLTIQESQVEYRSDMLNDLQVAGVTSKTRTMDGQSDVLANINLMFENEATGLSCGLFCNYRGETYVAGDTATQTGYAPALIEMPICTLDLTIGYKFRFGDNRYLPTWRLGLEFKNLMDPAIESAYRTPYEDFKRTSYTAGRTYGLSLGCNW